MDPMDPMDPMELTVSPSDAEFVSVATATVEQLEYDFDRIMLGSDKDMKQMYFDICYPYQFGLVYSETKQLARAFLPMHYLIVFRYAGRIRFLVRPFAELGSDQDHYLPLVQGCEATPANLDAHPDRFVFFSSNSAHLLRGLIEQYTAEFKASVGVLFIHSVGVSSRFAILPKAYATKITV